MNNILLRAVVLLCVGGIHCHVPFLGSCPLVTIKSNFVGLLYIGPWYEQEKYLTFADIGAKCQISAYGVTLNPSVISVTNIKADIFTGTISTVNGNAVLKSGLTKADMMVSYPSQFINVATPYQILETDYLTYSVVHGCTQAGLINYRYLSILTRDRFPPLSVMYQAYSIIDSNNLPRNFLTKTDQVNCNFDL